MIAGDPNILNVELVAAALGELREQLVLVGGCATSLLIDSPAAPPPRVTYDVDLVAEVAARQDYYALEREFAARGFARDLSPDAPLCRWSLRTLKVDLMPTDEAVLGFSNRWYAEAVRSAMRLALPSGASIRLISAPAFIGTKFEAFLTRGKADLLSSHDLEDLLTVVEGRSHIAQEVAAAEPALRRYLAEQFSTLVGRREFADVLPGLVAQDEMHAQRVAAVKQRVCALATPAA